MAEPEKDLDKLREEQAEDDADILADLDKESKLFDKVDRCTIRHTYIDANRSLGLRDRSHKESFSRQRLRRARSPAWRTR